MLTPEHYQNVFKQAHRAGSPISPSLPAKTRYHTLVLA
ncbi:ribonuclease P protein component [Vibrio variabilis]|uniref:Ribonuclease P protein component n=1 Tax=Vibrio variabilis TaxID=990271 RepID=A0ABQ0JEW9_9VIBR|nr:ribonuclease P protein component [Vibrio variabilis]